MAGFVVLYYTRFTLQPVVPPAIRYLVTRVNQQTMILLNAAIFVLFIVFLPYRRKIAWKSKGVFSAFILALFAEMFGIPLLLYIIYPLFGTTVAMLIPGVGKFYLHQHFFILGWPGVVFGSYLTLAGMILVVIGWRQIYKATSLKTDGIYASVRHPQYLGLILILTGWILHWTTVLMLMLYPVLLITYVRLSKLEDKELRQQYGEDYERYIRRVPAFWPLKLGRQRGENG